jgi:hypothetical protein
MKAINIEKLMGHSTGISDSYYRATEAELLEDYLKAIDFLTISNENKLILENQQVKRHNLQIEMDKDEIYSKLKELEPLLALKKTLEEQGLLKIS